MAYNGPERRSTHECIQEEEIGKIKEFIANQKSVRMLLGGVVVTILVQIITFVFLWGQLTTVVAKNTDFLWNDLKPSVKENTRSIDRMLAKFEDVKVVTVTQEK